MCIDWYLPGYRAGGPIRSCANLVAHLQDEISIYILCGDKDYQSAEGYQGIAKEQWSQGSMGEQVMYVDPKKMTGSFIRGVIVQGGFETIYIHGLFSRHFSIAPLRAVIGMDIRKIIAPRGMLRKSAIGIKSRKKRLFLSLAKASGWYKRVTFHATDAQEELDIRQWIAKSAVIKRAPNLPRTLLDRPANARKHIGALELVFAGRIAPEKNLAFALQVLSGLTGSSIVLDIYGAVYDEVYHEQCLQMIEAMPVNVSVRFFDPVPSDEVIGLLSRYHALFLPTRGENFGHIILESFMAARPVLISDQTPWKDIEKEGAGHSIPLAHPERYAEKISQWAKMDEVDFDELCRKSFEKAQRFCKDPELIAASKALFLPA